MKQLLTALATIITFSLPTNSDQRISELEAFGSLVVGVWEADDSRHVLEWGVGRRVIRSRGYFLQNGDWTHVSEGIWYWDAQARTVRGTVLAVDMPVDRFEYSSAVDGERIVHELIAHNGEKSDTFTETWTYSDDEYRWNLQQHTESGLKTVMGGTYRRAT